MTNPKIEKVKEQIAKTKEIISDYQAKLRELEKQKIELENLALIAAFRKEKLDEDAFYLLLHSMRKEETEPEAEPQTTPQAAVTAIADKIEREDLTDDNNI